MDAAKDLDRRTLLRAGGAAAGILALPPRLLPAADPTSAGSLVIHTSVPMNAEPQLDALSESWITPVEQFYIRSHAPTPDIDAESFRLSVEGLVERPFEISLRELRDEFTKQSVVATMTCAGNRRNEHSRIKTVAGVPWGAGAIGNARWGGVALSKLLRKAGLQENARHVWFDGADQIRRSGGVIPFGASIPLEKSLADSDAMPGALITFEMNGAPLTPDHGFPIRTVVPGFVGARSVKWLARVVVSDRPAPNHYVAKAYKLVVDGTDDEWSGADPVYTFPINSVTCLPAGAVMSQDGRVAIRGYALPPGDDQTNRIAKVEVSANGGRSWTRAQLRGPARPFCWQIWTVQLSLEPGNHDLVVRATDSDGHLQPRTVNWNLRGYLFNAWHLSTVKVS